MQNPTNVKLSSDRRVSQAWQLLLANPQVKVKELARSVGLSESRLEHLIAKHGGMSIREFKRQIRASRLREARRLLLETTDTIASIGESVGYQDTSNFIHDFKKLFGWTPAVYRRFEK